ncbi:hypothetical protein [Nocardioides sp.]|uniref:hypothetical protein n=1 Tax=Nocardioides sp. TaxID=35761 RepID=UPI0039E46342
MRRLLLAAPVLLALTACGAGTAVSVGDESISTEHVDEVTRAYCDALGTVSNGSAVPLQLVRSSVVNALGLRAAVAEFAASYDVTAGADYKQQVSALTQQLTQFDSATQQAIIDVEGAQAYITSVLAGVGAELEPSGSAATQTTAAQDALNTWLGEHDIDLNPVYGLDAGGVQLDEDTGGRFDSTDASVSLAVSDIAKTALGAGEDSSSAAAAAADLPQSQRCG